MLCPPGFTPKYSLGSWAFSFGPFASAPWSFEEVCRYTAACGFHGVEINGFRPHPHPDDYNTADKCRSLAGFLSDLGLGISGYAPDFSTLPPAEDEGSRYLLELWKALRFCERMGIRTLRVDSVSSPEKLSPEDYQRRWNRLVHNWRAAAIACADAGVTLVWEFEPGFWLNRPSEVKNLVEAVDHRSFRVLFDTSHAHMSAVVGARHGDAPEILPGGVVEFAELLRPLMGHLHLIDSNGELHNGETSIHAPFGCGVIDFPAVIEALAPEIWQLEWWCVDFCFCATTEKDARDAIPFMNRIIRPTP